MDPGEGEIIDYLLGGVDEARAEEIEMRLLTDPAFFEYAEEVEDLLIDSYVRGGMNAELRARFQAAYEASSPLRRRVEMAGSLRQAVLALSAPSRRRQRIWSPGKRLTFSLVFASVAVAALMAVFSVRLRHTPAVPPNRGSPEGERVVSLLVRPGRVRGQTAAPVILRVPSETTAVQIEMELPAVEIGREFRAILDSAERPGIASSGARAARSGTVTARFASGSFTTDDYVVRLVEPGPGSRERRVATYFFRVVK